MAVRKQRFRVRRTRLSELIRLYRNIYEVSLRECGQEIGVSAATLMRIEQGRVMDHTTYLKVLVWLGTE